MRRTAVFVLVAAMATAAVRAADLPALKQRGTLRVIVAADEAKETFDARGGSNPGFEREILEGFARKEGLRLETIRAVGHGQRIPMLLKGEGDMIVAIFDTAERRREVDFTSEVMPTHDVAVTLAPAARVAEAGALRVMRVAAVKGTSPAQAVLDLGVPPSALVLADTVDELVAVLQKKNAQAAVLPISEFALAAPRFPGLQAGATVGTPGRVAWAVRKEDRALHAALDEYLRLYRSGPSWNRLVVKYFGDQVLAVLGRAR
jgi:ABC-type amino acid transport substrate-binding protein